MGVGTASLLAFYLSICCCMHFPINNAYISALLINALGAS